MCLKRRGTHKKIMKNSRSYTYGKIRRLSTKHEFRRDQKDMKYPKTHESDAWLEEKNEDKANYIKLEIRIM